MRHAWERGGEGRPRSHLGEELIWKGQVDMYFVLMQTLKLELSGENSLPTMPGAAPAWGGAR